MQSLLYRCGTLAVLSFVIVPTRNARIVPLADRWGAPVERVEVPGACSEPGDDGDGDGLPDACEQAIAEAFAPIVHHTLAEPNLPTDVDVFLRTTALAYHDEDCGPDRVVLEAPTQADLLLARSDAACHEFGEVRADGTRSTNKRRTFYLRDVAPEHRAGSADTREWTTYFHAYRNDLGGVTVQYWRFYAYNDALTKHGGDWESVQVVLDGSWQPRTVRLLGHSGMEERAFGSLEREGAHVRVYSEPGGHATRASGDELLTFTCPFRGVCSVDPDDPSTYVRQETWSGGEVRFPDGRRSPSGRLVNLGEKSRPLNGHLFIRYSGLWGSPGRTYFTSGYWGPTFNETHFGEDGFEAAWCAGMRSDALATECYPDAVIR